MEHSPDTALQTRRGAAALIPRLPGELTPTGYRLPPGLPFDRWEEIGRSLSLVGRAVQWWIGDWLRYGEREYGQKYTQALEETGYDYGSLRNMVYVAERVELSRRRDNLSWSHHAEVAALEPEQQESWLDRAASDGLTRSELRGQLRAAAAPEAAGFRLTVELPRGVLSALRDISERLSCDDDLVVGYAIMYAAAALEEGRDIRSRL